MGIRLPMMIQDPSISQVDVGRLVEDWLKLDERHYLDGPVSERVAGVPAPDGIALHDVCPATCCLPREGAGT